MEFPASNVHLLLESVARSFPMDQSVNQVPFQELLARCVSPGDPSAWEEFVRRFHRPIARVVFRTCERLGHSSPGLVDDLVQDTYLKLCAENFRMLRQFVQQHPEAFLGYIKVIAANTARDHFKSIRTQRRGSELAPVEMEQDLAVARDGAPGTRKFMEQAVLLDQIGEHLDKCNLGPDKDRNATIFWLHYRLGLSAASIAALPEIGLGEKGVESTIIRLTRALRIQIAPAITPHVSGNASKNEGITPAESL
ncbi:MAG TPA: RNA polymerase sigma factor [Edaphobacter sp.]|nr:RNA polymerase sigma factor [Edaphobacter sp.]